MDIYIYIYLIYIYIYTYIFLDIYSVFVCAKALRIYTVSKAKYIGKQTHNRTLTHLQVCIYIHIHDLVSFG